MKTQINDLISGAKNVIRNMEDPKYIDAPQATSHIGYAGTNSDERNEIAEKVYEENGDTLNITALTSPSHRPHIALTSPSHRPHIALTSPSHCPHIALTLPSHCPHIALTLPIHRSTTGKSWSWGCPLTEEQYVALGGQYTEGTLKSYSLEVLMSCEVVLNSFTRRSEAAQWRSVGPMTYLDESFITIL